MANSRFFAACVFQRSTWVWCLSILSMFFPLSAAHAYETKENEQTPDQVEYIRKLIPQKIELNIADGELLPFQIDGRNAYVIRPTTTVDPARRWVWIFPFWLGVNDGHGVLHHRYYVSRYLQAGFHVAGIDVGTSCGSPRAAEICQRFYEHVRDTYALHLRPRLVVQSNGGLIGYAWASRHPRSVQRIAGICPATDFRTWPGLDNVINFPTPGLDYQVTRLELEQRIHEFNPIERLIPLARERVQVMHLHGTADDVVPIKENSLELHERFRAAGGSVEIVEIDGLGHGGKVLYESERLADFVIGDSNATDIVDFETADSFLIRIDVRGISDRDSPPDVDSRKSNNEIVSERELAAIEFLVQVGREFVFQTKSNGKQTTARGRLSLHEKTNSFRLEINLRETDVVEPDGIAAQTNLTHVQTELVIVPQQTVMIGGIETINEPQGSSPRINARRFWIEVMSPHATTQ